MTSPSHRTAAIAVLIFASFMDLMDTTVVNVALPSLGKALDATPAALEWTVGGYTLAFAVVLIIGGGLGDIYGRRRLFLLGVAGFTLASLAAAVAPTAGVLVAARLVQGGFAALMVPQVLATVQALYAPAERAAVYGVVGAVAGLAAVAGPLVGGGLVTADVAGLGWRAVFLVNVPVGVALMAAAARWVPDTRSSRPLRPDYRGMVLLTLALGLLVYPLVEGRQQGWPVWIFLLLAASSVVLLVLVLDQRRTDSALVPMVLFTRRGFSAGVVTQAAFTAAMGALFLVLALYLQLGLGFSAIRAGLSLLPFALAAMLGTGVSVPLAARFGKPLVILGALMQAGAVLWLREVVSAEADRLGVADLVWPLALAGVGLALLVIPLVDLALATVDVHDAGVASGVYNTFQQVGGALGVAVVGVVFFDRVGDFSATTLRTAFLAAAWVAFAGYAICALAAVLLPPSEAGATVAEEPESTAPEQSHPARR